MHRVDEALERSLGLSFKVKDEVGHAIAGICGERRGDRHRGGAGPDVEVAGRVPDVPRDLELAESPEPLRIDHQLASSPWCSADPGGGDRAAIRKGRVDRRHPGNSPCCIADRLRDGLGVIAPDSRADAEVLGWGL